MTVTGKLASSSVSAEGWEPLVEDGREIGEIHWLLQTPGGPVAGLWRIGTEDFPYHVTGSDIFHVIEGDAELETPSGDKIPLTPGGIYSFPDGFTATWRTRSPFLKFFVVA
jgi:uncharacterized cupin superfamily protein